jgi:hypothetical protein
LPCGPAGTDLSSFFTGLDGARALEATGRTKEWVRRDLADPVQVRAPGRHSDAARPRSEPRWSRATRARPVTQAGTRSTGATRIRTCPRRSRRGAHRPADAGREPARAGQRLAPGPTGWPTGRVLLACPFRRPPPYARLTCRAICSARRELIAPSAWAQYAASAIRASTARRLGSPAPIPANTSSAVETAVRSRRTSRSVSSSSAAARLTGDATIGVVGVRRENASERACRCRLWRERWRRLCAARVVDCICQTSAARVERPRMSAAAS